jgi:hypothetical protein
MYKTRAVPFVDRLKTSFKSLFSTSKTNELINVDDQSTEAMLDVIHLPSQLTYADHLHRQISMDEKTKNRIPAGSA